MSGLILLSAVGPHQNREEPSKIRPSAAARPAATRQNATDCLMVMLTSAYHIRNDETPDII